MLPPFPDGIDKLDTFPIPEGKNFEFKQSVKSIDKLLPTICAFLNAEGGYIVFGVIDNNRRICGLRINSKQVDDFILAHIDSIFQYKRIINQETKEPINPEYIRTEVIKRDDLTYVIVIKIISPDENITYQIYDGEVFYRLNASNMRIRSDKVYLEEQVTHMLINQKKSLEKEYANIIRSFNIEIKKQSKLIESLSSSNKKVEKILYDKILTEKNEMEQAIIPHNTFSLFRLFDCFK
jgi:predicted HTH transcriptional regulator